MLVQFNKCDSENVQCFIFIVAEPAKQMRRIYSKQINVIVTRANLRRCKTCLEKLVRRLLIYFSSTHSTWQRKHTTKSRP